MGNAAHYQSLGYFFRLLGQLSVLLFVPTVRAPRGSCQPRLSPVVTRAWLKKINNHLHPPVKQFHHDPSISRLLGPFQHFLFNGKKMSLPVSSLDSEKWDLPQAGERPLNLRSDSDEESTLWRLCINVNSRNTGLANLQAKPGSLNDTELQLLPFDHTSP